MTNPHFIIAGERRSGSTTLYELLKQHPDVDLYPVADMDYFINPKLFQSKEWITDFDQNKEWNESHSRQGYAELFNNLNFSKVVGQKDADLLFWKKAHPRLSAYLDDTKFIFVLRNPINRAESQYWNERGKNRERESFERAIELEEQRSKQSDYGRLHLNYLERGKYYISLEHFYQHIPKERVHVVILENLFRSPKVELTAIAEFLGISKEAAQEIKLVHSNKEEVMTINPALKGTSKEKVIRFYDRIAYSAIRRITKDKDKKAALRKKLMGFGKVSLRAQNRMKSSTVEQLREYYKEPNARLENLLNINLDIWNK